MNLVSNVKASPDTFQELIARLQDYWAQQGCVVMQPLDMEVGAGTFHPATFLRSIGPEVWNSAYVQPSRRPTDGRYGENPNRLQHYYQFQVVMKPSPADFQDLYLGSLEYLGIDLNIHDVRFVEDNWESPTLGAWGLGWEVWLNGMEVTQFTYFQQVGGLECYPVTGEITYGIEQLLCISKVLIASTILSGLVAQMVLLPTVMFSCKMSGSYPPTILNTLTQSFCLRPLTNSKQMPSDWLKPKLPLPAYEMVMKASHTLNLLDARKAISVTERQRFILRVRSIARAVAIGYFESRLAAGFPLAEKAIAQVMAKHQGESK